MAQDDATLALCGACRHFEQAFMGPHRCILGLPLLDGVARSECARFDPWPDGGGPSVLDTPDCCAHAVGEEGAHVHAEPPGEPSGVPPAEPPAEPREA